MDSAYAQVSPPELPQTPPPSPEEGTTAGRWPLVLCCCGVIMSCYTRALNLPLYELVLRQSFPGNLELDVERVPTLLNSDIQVLADPFSIVRKIQDWEFLFALAPHLLLLLGVFCLLAGFFRSASAIGVLALGLGIARWAIGGPMTWLQGMPAFLGVLGMLAVAGWYCYNLLHAGEVGLRRIRWQIPAVGGVVLCAAVAAFSIATMWLFVANDQASEHNKFVRSLQPNTPLEEAKELRERAWNSKVEVVVNRQKASAWHWVGKYAALLGFLLILLGLPVLTLNRLQAKEDRAVIAAGALLVIGFLELQFLNAEFAVNKPWMEVLFGLQGMSLLAVGVAVLWLSPWAPLLMAIPFLLVAVMQGTRIATEDFEYHLVMGCIGGLAFAWLFATLTRLGLKSRWDPPESDELFEEPDQLAAEPDESIQPEVVSTPAAQVEIVPIQILKPDTSSNQTSSGESDR